MMHPRKSLTASKIIGPAQSPYIKCECNQRCTSQSRSLQTSAQMCSGAHLASQPTNQPCIKNSAGFQRCRILCRQLSTPGPQIRSLFPFAPCFLQLGRSCRTHSCPKHLCLVPHGPVQERGWLRIHRSHRVLNFHEYAFDLTYSDVEINIVAKF